MIDVDIQRACDQSQLSSELPKDEQFELWASCTIETATKAAIKNDKKDAELSIRLVNAQESQQLNHQYRGKDKPTNVLSFEFQAPIGIQGGLDINLLGDLVICASVVEQEAKQQNKAIFDHWCHMVVHGCLHLLGYDHITNEEAEIMEQLEIDILHQLGINNPYIVIDTQ